mgnify:CR=1 FL=1
MCKVYQERKIQDVNLNRKTIFNCEEKQYISKQKCKVNPGIVTVHKNTQEKKQCFNGYHCFFYPKTSNNIY